LAASAAIDGSLTTRWSSAFADPQWLLLDLGATRYVSRVVLRWENAASSDYEVDIGASATGPWTVLRNDPAGNGGVDDLTGLAGAGRYVRMYSRHRTTPYGNSLYEMEVYGDNNPNCSGGPPVPVCGNGVVESGEACDDGNTVDTDTCRNNCVRATCSDGLKNQGEIGTDCGGPCAACAGTPCQAIKLNRAAASASSSEGAGFAASAAIDNNLATRWSSLFSDPQWLIVDLGAAAHISRVVLRWEDAASSNFDLDVADSAAGPWTTLRANQVGTRGGADDITGLNANRRYVRMYSRQRATPYGVSLWELEVYGDPSTTCAP
jgi:cysteine-rich repeat protein